MKYLLLILVLSGAAFGAVCDGSDSICYQTARSGGAFPANFNMTITSTSTTTHILHLDCVLDFGQTISAGGIGGLTNTTWALVKSQALSAGSGTATMYQFKGTITGATGTGLTIAPSSGPFAGACIFTELAATATEDGTAVSNVKDILAAPCPPATDCTTPTTASYTATVNDIFVASNTSNLAGTNLLSTPSGYTCLPVFDLTGFYLSSCYKSVSAGAQSAQWTISLGSNWATIAQGFKLAGGSTPKRLRGSVSQ